MNLHGKKLVSGSTTLEVVSRELGKEVKILTLAKALMNLLNTA